MLLSLLRTMIFYVLLVAVVRLLGKRQIGQMEPSEFVLTMLLANLATIPIEELETPASYGIFPILLVFGVEYLMSVLTLHNIKLRRLFCGKPVILIENGKISARNLRRTRLNLDELTMHLREKGIFDLSTVKFAILETNGQLSTMFNAKDEPAPAGAAGIRVKENELPVTLISDGRLIDDNLALTSRDGAWVRRELQKRSCKLEDVLLMTLDAAGSIYFVRKEQK